MKVILIGKGNGWENAPQEGNTWGVHSLCLRRPVEMVFDMHKIGDSEYLDNLTIAERIEQGKIFEYVIENDVPLVTLKKLDNIPSSIEFPLDKMPLEYAECSIVYMIVYAMIKGATEIDMYGVVLEVGDEYTIQRKSVEYWIGYARGKGITVTINEPTCLCKSERGLYGYDYV